MSIESKLIQGPPALPFAPSKNGSRAQVEQAIRQILQSVGEDPRRDGLRNTPKRVARMYDELLAGYTLDPVKLINDACFEADYQQMIVVKDIEFFSLCEHHLLPFFGKVHIGYIPKGQVLGLSKMPRVVEMFARRLQLQERMTQETAQFLNEVLHPEGVGVRVTAQHLCTMMRGVRKLNAKMVTQARLGKFEEKETYDQFYQEICQRDSVSAVSERGGEIYS